MNLTVLFNCLLFLVMTASAWSAEPPRLFRKEAVRASEPMPGETMLLDGQTSLTLFVHRDYTVPDSGEVRLSIHMHGAPWFMVQEHVRRGAKNPFIACSVGAGSSAYEQAFKDPAVLPRVLRSVEAELKRLGARDQVRITQVEVSSFSAGYAAVRELLRQPENRAMIDRVVLGDSLYASDTEDPEGILPGRRPAWEDIEPFVLFAREAQQGRGTFLFHHSSIPSLQSVGPMDCSLAIQKALWLEQREVPRGSTTASAADVAFPLVWRADDGNAHFWCYDGIDSEAHLAHLRNAADLWKAMD